MGLTTKRSKVVQTREDRFDTRAEELAFEAMQRFVVVFLDTLKSEHQKMRDARQGEFVREDKPKPVEEMRQILHGNMVRRGSALTDALAAAHHAVQAALTAGPPSAPWLDEALETYSSVAVSIPLPIERELKHCVAGRDGECAHPACPQLRDGEPVKSGRHCPLDVRDDEE